VYSRVSTSSSAGSGKAVKKNARGKVIAEDDDIVSSRELPPDFVRHRTLLQHPPQLVVHKSRIHGMGVYTLTPIKQGDMVIEYQVSFERRSF
jgi:SET domain-containing protein